MNTNDYLEKVKLLLQADDPPPDELLLYLIDDCINRVLGYCRRQDIPPELETLIPIMTVRYYHVSGFDGSEDIQSVSQGQRSVTFASGTVRRDDWLNDFKTRLDPFRCRKGMVPSDFDE